jgi:hypothetical protein
MGAMILNNLTILFLKNRNNMEQEISKQKNVLIN